MSEELKAFIDEEVNELVNEPKISCATLLQEIEPLLKDFFHSIVDRSADKITLSFLNGQKFAIIANEIVD